MSEPKTPRRPPSGPLRRDRRGVTTVDTALVAGPFLTLLFLIIEVGIYFTFQSALDTGLLITAEGLRSTITPTYGSWTAATLGSTIVANGGAVLSTSSVTVDVRQLATLSASAPASPDGTTVSCTSGTPLILRAQATVPFIPSTTQVTLTSTAVIRCPLAS